MTDNKRMLWQKITAPIILLAGVIIIILNGTIGEIIPFEGTLLFALVAVIIWMIDFRTPRKEK